MMNRIIKVCLVLMAISLPLSGQGGKVIQKKVIYKEVHGTKLTVDVFTTEELMKNDNNPAIAFFHGGGWAGGSPSEFFTTCERYAKKGFVTFSFSYRMSLREDGRIPNPDITPIESTKDARSALRWIKENAASMQIDPEKVLASGQSAGGQLALSTACMENINESTDNLDIDPTPMAFLLYSSNFNTVEAWCDYLLGQRRKEIWSISPYHNLKAGMPPIIEFHGTEDPQVPYYIVNFYVLKTRELGNSMIQIPFEETGHYLAEGDNTYATYFDEAILERTDEFLRELGLMK